MGIFTNTNVISYPTTKSALACYSIPYVYLKKYVILNKIAIGTIESRIHLQRDQVYKEYRIIIMYDKVNKDIIRLNIGISLEVDIKRMKCDAFF